jgi:hypothetical protein
MTKQNAGDKSRPPQIPRAPQAPETELDFESLVAAAIAEIVIKPKKKKTFRPIRRRE